MDLFVYNCTWVKCLKCIPMGLHYCLEYRYFHNAYVFVISNAGYINAVLCVWFLQTKMTVRSSAGSARRPTVRLPSVSKNSSSNKSSGLKYLKLLLNNQLPGFNRYVQRIVLFIKWDWISMDYSLDIYFRGFPWCGDVFMFKVSMQIRREHGNPTYFGVFVSSLTNSSTKLRSP